jgi:hypothetical protein
MYGKFAQLIFLDDHEPTQDKDFFSRSTAMAGRDGLAFIAVLGR